MKSLIAALTIVGATNAWSACACLCAEGRPQTICTTVEEAGSGLSLCGDRSVEICPHEFAPPVDGQLHDAPEGATNCRSMWVWDSVHQSPESVKVCEVLAS